MSLLRLEDFRLIPALDVRRDPKMRMDYFNLLTIMMNEPDPKQAAIELEQSPAYEASWDSTDDLYPEYVLISGDGKIAGTTTLDLMDEPYGITSTSAIDPDLLGYGYGSILLARTVEQAGKLGFTDLTAKIYDADNKASYQRFDRLVAASLARRAADEMFNDEPVRIYKVPTHQPVEAYYNALATKPLPVRPTPRTIAMHIANQLKR